MKRFNLYLLRNRHIWPLLYALIYVPWFLYLENKYDTLKNVTIIHTKIDDLIPFCEIFIIPYMIWFLYIPLIFVLLYFSSNKEFYRLCAYEFIGMTIALFICTVFPNGHDLRVDLGCRDNIFMTLLSFIYTNDTSTNVLPSIHVFATLAAHTCLISSPQVKVRPYIKPLSAIAAGFICVSTVVLKQHSIVDSLCGALLAFALYFFIFKFMFKNVQFREISHDKHQVLFWLNNKTKKMYKIDTSH
ncbi:MAG: phosphoesterase [Lachnospiraceae bacterium]|nr:phosphoesterase [Lachnospiraceae bacterium]